MVNGSEETYIILEDYLLTGVTNVSFKNSVEEEVSLLLNNAGLYRNSKKPNTASCEISTYYLGPDLVQNLTGFTNLSGQFIYGENAINFDNAVITNYSINGGVGKACKTSFSLEIFGELTPTTELRINSVQEYFQPELVESINQQITLDDFNSPINNFNYSVDFELGYSSELSDKNYSNIKIITPVKHKLSAGLKMMGQEFKNFSGYVSSENQFSRDVNLILYDRTLNESLTELQNSYDKFPGTTRRINFEPERAYFDEIQMPNAGLKSQDVSSSAGSSNKFSLSYEGYSASVRTGSPTIREPVLYETDYPEIQYNYTETPTEFVSKNTGDITGLSVEYLRAFYNIITSEAGRLCFEDFESFDTGVMDIKFNYVIPGIKNFYSQKDLISFYEEDFEDLGLNFIKDLDASAWETKEDYEDNTHIVYDQKLIFNNKKTTEGFEEDIPSVIVTPLTILIVDFETPTDNITFQGLTDSDIQTFESNPTITVIIR